MPVSLILLLLDKRNRAMLASNPVRDNPADEVLFCRQ